jgi:hypothetical protein
MSDLDPEIQAMSQVAAALQPLTDDAVARVLRWAAERHGISGVAKQTGLPSEEETGRPADIGELFAGATPRSDADRALLAAYWFQQYEGTRSLTGQQINSALKQMGVGIGNITQALTGLIDQRPALVQQLSKSGRSRQARKQYRLTSAGLEAARVLTTHGDQTET